MSETVTLRPLAMHKTGKFYHLSRLRPVKTITLAEFLERYADHPQPAMVSLNGDEPTLTTMYGYGLDVWYVLDGGQ